MKRAETITDALDSRKKQKYTVLQTAEVKEYLTQEQKMQLDGICDAIFFGKRKMKKPLNSYFVAKA